MSRLEIKNHAEWMNLVSHFHLKDTGENEKFLISIENMLSLAFLFEDNKLITQRSDFIGDYIGQTKEKTRKFLSENMSKYEKIIIDPKLLYLDDKDDFGKESVNALINFIYDYEKASIYRI